MVSGTDAGVDVVMQWLAAHRQHAAYDAVTNHCQERWEGVGSPVRAVNMAVPVPDGMRLVREPLHPTDA